MHCIGICPYQDQPLGCVRINLKFSETFQKIFRVLGIAMEQGTDDKMLLICLMLAVLVQFLLTDQKAGNALGKKSIFAHFFR